MSYDLDDTICAVATAAGGSARGMVRVSGPSATEIVGRVFRSRDGSLPSALRVASVVPGDAIIALAGDKLRFLPCDAFFWPTSRSYTREPVVELHTLGSPPLLESLVEAVCRAGARPAEPGEFTLRAFLAGRIDLTQAEAVLGVIDAHGEQELSTALAQLAGGLSQPLQLLRNDLLQLLAELEAGLDFVDEDIEFISRGELLAKLRAAQELLADVESQMTSRATSSAAPQVALVGAPNAGKSSLFNAIIERFGSPAGPVVRPISAAIVSSRRGTTRDYLTARIDLDGFRFDLVDTAGVEERSATRDDGTLAAIDREAQKLAQERREQADVRVYCVDASDAESILAAGNETAADVIAFTKSDLIEAQLPRLKFPEDVKVVSTSSMSKAGLDELCQCIRSIAIGNRLARRGMVVSATAERCRESVRLAAAAVGNAEELIENDAGNELAAAELRAALAELGKVVGAVYTDDLLDRIFSTFCIGK
jgi:tRNA modification GTPase